MYDPDQQHHTWNTEKSSNASKNTFIPSGVSGRSPGSLFLWAPFVFGTKGGMGVSCVREAMGQNLLVPMTDNQVDGPR